MEASSHHRLQADKRHQVARVEISHTLSLKHHLIQTNTSQMSLMRVGERELGSFFNC